MKRKSLIISNFLALTMLLSMLFITSCSKDEIESDENQPTEILNLRSESDIEFTKRIESFRENVIKPNNLKSTESMNFDEAVYLMEATYNYFHGFSSESFINCECDSIFIPINDVTEYITMSNIQELYIDINNRIYELFQEVNLPDKHIKFVDIEEKTDELLIMLYIGQMVSLKSTNNDNSIDEYEFSWPNQTPYNSQMGDTWSYSSSWGYSEADAALEDDIDLPFTPKSRYEYWTDIWNTGYQDECKGWDPIFSSTNSFDYYEMFQSYPPIPLANLDSDILHPIQEHSFWPYYYGWKYPSSNNWNKISGISLSANYIQMNKYYNCVYTFIDFYKKHRISSTTPSNAHREPIDFDLKINNIIDENYNGTREYLTITGEIKITYAVRRTIPDKVPCLAPGTL